MPDRHQTKKTVQQTVRQWRLVQALDRGRNLEPALLAEALGVSKKTIRRDVEDLIDAGFPIRVFLTSRGGDTDHRRAYLAMDSDWMKGCPDPLDPTDLEIDITEVGDKMTSPRPKRMAAGVVGHNFGKTLEVKIVKGEERRRMLSHHMCSCGHHMTSDKDRNVEGYNPTCPSCKSWVKNLRAGNIV